MNINLAIVERAKAGEALTAAELDELATADVLSLGMLADEVRRARVGDTVTYTQDAESRLDHAARDAGGCGGAAFAKRRRHSVRSSATRLLR